MALPQSPTTPTDFDGVFPPLTRSSTAPGTLHSPRPDRSRLAPEDAFSSLPRGLETGNGGEGSDLRSDLRTRRLGLGETGRSRSRRRKRTWKKLLWVKQSCMFQWGQ